MALAEKGRTREGLCIRYRAFASRCQSMSLFSLYGLISREFAITVSPVVQAVRVKPTRRARAGY